MYREDSENYLYFKRVTQAAMWRQIRRYRVEEGDRVEGCGSHSGISNCDKISVKGQIVNISNFAASTPSFTVAQK